MSIEPLLEMRDWLKALREDNSKRSARRRDGSLNFVGDGRLIPGPFTLQARREILERLLATQDEVGFDLISSEEIEAIRSLWVTDALNLERTR